MKKRNIYFVVLLLLAGLTIVCDKAETLVQPEERSYRLLSVINPGDLLLPDSLYLSTLRLSYDKTVFSNSRVKSSYWCELFIINPSMSGKDTLHSIHCGSVNLGSLTLEEVHANCPDCSHRSIGLFDSTYVMMYDWKYWIHSFSFQSEMFRQLVGPTEFRITGSNVIQDVVTIIDIPERNEIISPQPGAVVNINEDLVVQLKRPIGGKLIQSKEGSSEKVILYRSNTDKGSTGIYAVYPIEPSNEIIIPGSVLQKSVDSCPEAKYCISLQYYHRRDDWLEAIPIYDKNGNAFTMLKPSYFDSYKIDIVLK